MANMAHGYDHVDIIIHVCVKSAVIDDKMRKCMGPTKTTTRMSPNRLVCFLLFADPESLNILVGWNHQGSNLQVDDQRQHQKLRFWVAPLFQTRSYVAFSSSDFHNPPTTS